MAPGPTAGVPRRGVLAPAIALAVVVTASAVVQLNAIQADIVRSGPAAAAAFDFIISDYFRSRSAFECHPCRGVLPRRARPVRRGRGDRRPRQGLRHPAAGDGVDRRGGRRRLQHRPAGDGVAETDRRVGRPRAAHRRRFESAPRFPDPNAAGSYLAMGLLVAVGVGVGTRIEPPGADRAGWRRRLDLLWLAAIPVIASGLWLTGSRAALAAVVAASVLLVPLARRAPKGFVRSATLAVVLALVALLPFAAERLNPPEATGRALPRAFSIRVEMARTAGRMIGVAPRVRRRGWRLPRAFGRIRHTRVPGDRPARERPQQLPSGAGRTGHRRVRAVRVGAGGGRLVGRPVMARGAAACGRRRRSGRAGGVRHDVADGPPAAHLRGGDGVLAGLGGGGGACDGRRGGGPAGGTVPTPRRGVGRPVSGGRPPSRRCRFGGTETTMGLAEFARDPDQPRLS